MIRFPSLCPDDTISHLARWPHGSRSGTGKLVLVHAKATSPSTRPDVFETLGHTRLRLVSSVHFIYGGHNVVHVHVLCEMEKEPVVLEVRNVMDCANLKVVLPRDWAVTHRIK